MAKLLSIHSGLRRVLADAFKQAQQTLKQNESGFLAPSIPGMIGPDDCRLLPHTLVQESTPAQEKSVTPADWPDVGLVTTNFPVLVFVLEGEADLRFGITPAVSRSVASLPEEIAQYVVTARAHQFLLIPADFPRPDGSDIHWERPDRENAASTLMWITFRPTGCFIHLCKTEGQEHSLSKSIYLTTPRASRLIEEAQAEVLQRRAQWKAATRLYFELILLLLQRDLGSAQVELGSVEATHDAIDGGEPNESPSHPAVERARRFIEDRLQDALRTPQIAAAAGVSVSSLNQLFPKYVHTSVAQYVVSRRIDRASTLLRETNLAIGLVATQCGFSHQEHFSRTFRRIAGVSPLAYRRQYQRHD